MPKEGGGGTGTRKGQQEIDGGLTAVSLLTDVTVLCCVWYISQAINRRRIKSGPDMQPITYYIDPSGTLHV